MHDQRVLAAHHEAGHAVAACLRGDSSLSSVSLGERHGDGLARSRGRRWDRAFVLFAGPWAEARYLWADRTAPDEDGCIFDDYLLGVFLEQPDDARDYSSALAEWVPRELVAATEQTWADELAAVAGAIDAVAAALLAGAAVTDADVRAHLGGDSVANAVASGGDET